MKELIKKLPENFVPVSEWHIDLGQTAEEFLAELNDEIVGYLHWPVTP